MMRFVLVFVALAACFAVSNASLAVTEYPGNSYNPGIFQCLRKSGIQSVLVDCLYTGRVDPECSKKVSDAWANGMDFVDIYMMPCFSCKTPKEQIQLLHDHLAANGTKFRYLWVHVSDKYGWSPRKSENVAFMKELLSAIGEYFKDQFGGIRTNKDEWFSIMGLWHGCKKYSLWWYSFDHVASFSNWKSFGGWKKPAMKLYTGNENYCGLNHTFLTYYE